MDNLLALEIELFKDHNFDFITKKNGFEFPKQDEALQILTDTNTTELTYGGAAGGSKSWTGCVWEAFSCLAYPETKYFIGREELKRLRDSTLLTFFKVCKEHNILRDEHFKYNGQDHFIEFYNGSRIDLLDLKYLPSDPLYERYGSVEYTGGWIEEAGEVHFGAYDTLKSRVGRHLNDEYNLLRKLFKTCNPKKNWLYQNDYKPWKEGRLPKGIKFIQAYVQDNPYNESGYEDALKSIKDKSKKERLLFGNWEYDDDPAKLMEYDSITNLFTNDVVGRDEHGKLKELNHFISCDPARFGSDLTVIMVWEGYRVVRIESYAKTSIPETVDYITILANKYSVPRSRIVVDSDGLGGGVSDYLRCKDFQANRTPIDSKGKKQNYNNLKSQCYFKLAEMVNKSEIFIDSQDTGVNDKIIEELEVVKQKDVDKDNKMGIIPKDKVKELIGRSPDYADCLSFRMFLDLSKTGIMATV